MRRSTSRRGFSLVDVLAVVVIVGLLASIGVVIMRKQVVAAHIVEVSAVMQSIRAAEETWRAENLTYLNVSTQSGWYPRNPAAGANGDGQMLFFLPPESAESADNARWYQLNPRVDAPVRCGYIVNAGLPGTAMTPPEFSFDGFTWPATQEPWFVIQATSDLDSDGDPAFYMMSSLNSEMAMGGDEGF